MTISAGSHWGLSCLISVGHRSRHVKAVSKENEASQPFREPAGGLWCKDWEMIKNKAFLDPSSPSPCGLAGLWHLRDSSIRRHAKLISSSFRTSFNAKRQTRFPFRAHLIHRPRLQVFTKISGLYGGNRSSQDRGLVRIRIRIKPLSVSLKLVFLWWFVQNQ